MKTSDEFLKAYLNSKWTIKRAIHHTNGEKYFFEGQAAFAMLNEGEMLYQEKGYLKGYTQREFETFRNYIYGAYATKVIQVKFADGSPFYDIECLKLPEVILDHKCLRDHYHGKLKYEFDHIEMSWRVKGPGKDYYLTSLLSREAEAFREAYL